MANFINDAGVYYLNTRGRMVYTTSTIEEPHIKSWSIADHGLYAGKFFDFLIDARKCGADAKQICELAQKYGLPRYIPGCFCKIYHLSL